ncbi:hypothetical protein ACQ33O_11905 [Ferruginibacter sp. SUN002]|uniref:hypothetical protein n=1 Tax=Ferruginibacter sp. SUN002 TaxID=2937789 RepID=UPI003D359EFD
MTSRILSTILLCLFFNYVSFAQKLAKDVKSIIVKKEKKRKKDNDDRKTPLSDEAFKKMMRDFYTFTIAGSTAPTTGFKVETAKPTLSLSGNINPKKYKDWIINLQLTGGLKDNFAQLFSKNKLNAYFKSSLGINRFIGKHGSYNYSSEWEANHIKALDKANAEKLLLQADSAIAINNLTLVEDYYSYKELWDQVVLDAEETRKEEEAAETKDFYKDLINGLIIYYGGDPKLTDTAQIFADFKGKLLRNDATIKTATILSDNSRLKPIEEKRLDSTYDFAIEKFKNIWTGKRIWWLNLSPTFTAGSTTFYDTLKRTIDDSISTTYGLQLSLNMLHKFKESGRYFYFKFLVEGALIDNVSDLSKFDYVKNKFYDTANMVALSENASGTAYKGSLERGFGFTTGLEIYTCPFKHTLAPGFYVASKYKYGDKWVNKNKVALDLGLIWNVTNSDKDSKNLLSIIPYASWSNILPEYTNALKTKETKRALKELFSVGLKVAIPFNLGKD